MVATVIATFFGAGFVPVAPGTAGAAAAIPFAILLDHLGTLSYWLALVGLTGIGIWAADVYDEAWETHDAQKIVVDEAAGLLLTVAFVPRTAFNLVVGFGLFRLFDTWKPWPVRWADREVNGGLGSMLDDLLAALYAGGLLYIIERTGLMALLTGYLSSRF
ncbi:MAG TPA: phosphatidylglycerophosphatase A [Polyangia bacterium]